MMSTCLLYVVKDEKLYSSSLNKIFVLFCSVLYFHVKYNLLQGPVCTPGFIYLLDIIQLRIRSLRPPDKVIV